MPSYIRGSQNPYLAAPIHGASYAPETEFQIARRNAAITSQYLMPLSAARVMDARLESIRPSLYTNVSKNDKVMRALLHDFILYGYDWACVLQLNDFLDDMLAHRHDFCSPLLVNVVLAYSTVNCANHKTMRVILMIRHSTAAMPSLVGHSIGIPTRLAIVSLPRRDDFGTSSSSLPLLPSQAFKEAFFCICCTCCMEWTKLRSPSGRSSTDAYGP